MTDHDDYAERVRRVEQRLADQDREIARLAGDVAREAAPALVAGAEDLLTRPSKQRAIDELARRGVLDQPCGCNALSVPTDEFGEPDYSRATPAHRPGCPYADRVS